MAVFAEFLSYVRAETHRDISSRNLLLKTSPDANFAALEAVSGTSDAIEKSRYACLLHLQERMRRQALPTTQKDIFAVGSAIYEILTEHSPYSDKSSAEVKVLYSEEKWPLVEGLLIRDSILPCWRGNYKTV